MEITSKLGTKMKKLIIIAVMLATACAPKYQVVQELDVNMYHMYNAKDGVVIIFTPDKLEINGWYKMKDINILNPANQYKK